MRNAVLLLALIACKRDDDVVDTWVIDDTGATDLDGDGYAAPEDCDDADPAVHPAAPETCDGTDEDCDGRIDEDPADGLLVYPDADGDGIGASEGEDIVCDVPPGFATKDGDCDDTDPAVNPLAPEDDCTDPKDYNCDGSTGYADVDNDGFAACKDCDDDDADVHPDALETCDGRDQDCDGVVDEDATDPSTFYVDADGDGHGDPAATVLACAPSPGVVASADDCDDTRADTSPSGTETCDGADQDCDGEVDEDATDRAIFHPDADGDGYGSGAGSVIACSVPPGYVSDSTDCDDAAPAVHPGATEACDGVDSDCDADLPADEADLDGDGTAACAGDCDDDDAAVRPGATETCDGRDEDCDGEIDEEPSDGSAYFVDGDGDGFGDPDRAAFACAAPTGHVDDDTDCDDAAKAINPDAAEVCDGVDDDCDGAADQGFTDTDKDGIANCVDPTVYSTNFAGTSLASFGWSSVNLGGGNAPNWSVAGNTLGERSNAAKAIALGPDLDAIPRYRIVVETWVAAGGSDYAGIVFDYEDAQNYRMLAWYNPTGYYAANGGKGQLQLLQVKGGATTVQATSGTADLTAALSQVVTLRLDVDGDRVQGRWNGTRVIDLTLGGQAPIGAEGVGLYTNDNDGGVSYQKFRVVVP